MVTRIPGVVEVTFSIGKGRIKMALGNAAWFRDTKSDLSFDSTARMYLVCAYSTVCSSISTRSVAVG